MQALRLQHSICSNSPDLKGMLSFSLGSSRPPVYFWNVLFWDDSGLNVRYLWIFKSITLFINSMWRTWLLVIRCVRCSWPPSSSWAIDPCQQKHLKETCNSFRKSPLNLWWISNKTIIWGWEYYKSCYF